jgi:hypothetical protein
MSELYTHCQCDNCTGEDCGQDNPEEYEKEREKERDDIRKAEQNEVIDRIITHCRERAEECPDDETYTDSEMEMLVEWIEEEFRGKS